MPASSCPPRVSMWGGWGFRVCFSPWAVFTDFYPHPAHPYWHGKVLCAAIILVSTDFQCDGAWCLLLTGLSWIPYAFSSVCLMGSPYSGTIPHPHPLLMSLTILCELLFQDLISCGILS